MNFIKLRCKNKEEEVCHYEDLLCCFGIYALNIWPDCNINDNSNSELGDEYEEPSANERYALAGSKHFKVLEMEAYKVL